MSKYHVYSHQDAHQEVIEAKRVFVNEAGSIVFVNNTDPYQTPDIVAIYPRPAVVVKMKEGA